MQKRILQGSLIKEGKFNTLIVLDACRYDTFVEVAYELNINGDLKCVDSEVLGTATWYFKNWMGFPGESELIGIIANPWGMRYSLKFIETYKAWDETADAAKVDPDRTMEFYRKYAAGKKAMIHFIPPHQPFISPKGLDLYKKLGIDLSGMGGTNWDDRDNFKSLSHIQKWISAYGRKGHWPEVKDAYKDNVRFILEKILRWMPEFLPPVVITADHGEVVGEGGPNNTGGYGHCHSQPNVIKYQRLVPWLTFKKKDYVKERLKILGY